MPIFNNVCQECAHYNGNSTCSAFPARIPDNIWEGRTAHLERLPTQVGQDVLSVPTQAQIDYLVQIDLVPKGAVKPSQGDA